METTMNTQRNFFDANQGSSALSYRQMDRFNQTNTAWNQDTINTNFENSQSSSSNSVSPMAMAKQQLMDDVAIKVTDLDATMRLEAKSSNLQLVKALAERRKRRAEC